MMAASYSVPSVRLEAATVAMTRLGVVTLFAGVSDPVSRVVPPAVTMPEYAE